MDMPMRRRADAAPAPPRCAALAPIPRSTCGATPSGGSPRMPATTPGAMPEPQRRVPPRIQALISELGLRYRPTSQTDIEAHSATLALLARDLAEMPPALLDGAIARWAQSRPFLPKACELIAIARDLLPAPERDPPGRAISDRYNDRIVAEGAGHRPLRWREDAHGNLFLVGDNA